MIGTKRRFTTRRHFPPTSTQLVVFDCGGSTLGVKLHRHVQINRAGIRTAGCCCAAKIELVLF
jgi:hypothetical protein